MSATKKTVHGGCLCGAVRFEATGGPVVAYVSFPAERVRWTLGERKRYESSPGYFRGFCSDCGTSLTCEPPRGVVEFHISTLDNPNDYPPIEHVHHNRRIAWFEVADELPR